MAGSLGIVTTLSKRDIYFFGSLGGKLTTPTYIFFYANPNLDTIPTVRFSTIFGLALQCNTSMRTKERP